MMTVEECRCLFILREFKPVKSSKKKRTLIIAEGMYQRERRTNVQNEESNIQGGSRRFRIDAR